MTTTSILAPVLTGRKIVLAGPAGYLDDLMRKDTANTPYGKSQHAPKLQWAVTKAVMSITEPGRSAKKMLDLRTLIYFVQHDITPEDMDALLLLHKYPKHSFGHMCKGKTNTEVRGREDPRARRHHTSPAEQRKDQI
ncbi:hypothetical protein IWX90DRAFT_417877 [Phyllosticta citrichinensis]|uniref:Uncharacterized protein n=1 Tax=Phyllosticta citrichinensis TaxID=1130410 RepID=A0ABR1XJH4_9PEZI